MTKELTKQDRGDFNVLKAVIRKHKDSLFEVATALQAIRDRKLWRGSHDSYEDFCLKEYGFTHRSANRLISPPKLPDENSPEGGGNGDLGHSVSQSGPGATGNGESEAATTTPKSSAPDHFKKLDDLIGKAIRAVDEIGTGGRHDQCLALFTLLLEELKDWKAAA